MTMKSLSRIVLVFALSPLLNAHAIAQGAPPFFIEGVPAFCSDDVETVVLQNAPTLIEAQAQRIVINGPVFDTLAPGIRLFVYYQTCGVMAFGDNLGLADTWAARVGMTYRWLSAADVETICQTDLLSQAGWYAAPDAARCENIYETMRAQLQGGR